MVVKLGDGSKGWPEQAPFDRIMVTAAAPDSSALVDQLGEDGIMVVPVGGDTRSSVSSGSPGRPVR